MKRIRLLSLVIILGITVFSLAYSVWYTKKHPKPVPQFEMDPLTEKYSKEPVFDEEAIWSEVKAWSRGVEWTMAQPSTNTIPISIDSYKEIGAGKIQIIGMSATVTNEQYNEIIMSATKRRKLDAALAEKGFGIHNQGAADGGNGTMWMYRSHHNGNGTRFIIFSAIGKDCNESTEEQPSICANFDVQASLSAPYFSPQSW